MKIVVAIVSLAVAATASAQGGPHGSTAPALSVNEVIHQQRAHIGTRVRIRGRLSECQPRSCVISGRREKAMDRFLSIGRNAGFDAVAGRYAGRIVEIEALLTDLCLQNVDPTIVPLCADRSSTLVDPIFLRAL